MRAAMNKWILAIAGILFLSGCKTRSTRSVQIENRTDSIYIDRLVPYPVPADSASIRALMECDENGKVILRWLDIANSKNVELQLKIDSMGQIIADMKVKHDTLLLPSKEIYIDRKVQVPVPVERELSRWEVSCIKWFPYSMGAILITLVYIFRKQMRSLIRRFI